MTINIWVWLHQDFFDFALRTKVKLERGTFAQLTPGFDRPSHLLDDLFTDWKTKAGALLISLWIFIEFAKVDEQVIETLLWNAYPSVLNRKTETYEAFLANLNFRLILLPLFQGELFHNIGNRNTWTQILFIIFEQLIYFFWDYFVMVLLDVNNINLYNYVAIFICEFHGIRDEVQNNLQESAFISPNLMHFWEVV